MCDYLGGDPDPGGPGQGLVTVQVTLYSPPKFTQSRPAQPADLMRWKCVTRAGPVPSFTVLGNPLLPVYPEAIIDGREAVVGVNGATRWLQVKNERADYWFEIQIGGEVVARFFDRKDDAIVFGQPG